MISWNTIVFISHLLPAVDNGGLASFAGRDFLAKHADKVDETRGFLGDTKIRPGHIVEVLDDARGGARLRQMRQTEFSHDELVVRRLVHHRHLKVRK